ncbi:putative lysine-specific demethylase 4A [Frankliniella fusca]|uniref:Lysine-specific demethylase 4A n=1 Tax=Frankliniella fusca TaxID=407009 RepID=A0AAE1HGK4_9NEOP|nr:putative lysine-specific demethylase 4A [Frankliniella fusca]
MSTRPTVDYSVQTVSINEHQLFNIPDFAYHIEKSDRIVKKAGVFKVILDETMQKEGSPIEQFLNVNESTFRDKKGSCMAIKQFLIKYKRNPNIYGFKASSMNFKAKSSSTLKDGDEFLEALNNPENYKMITCCSSILENNDNDKLITHFFNDVVSRIALENCTPHKSPTHQSVVDQGQKDALNIEDFLRSMKTLPLCERERLINQSLKDNIRSECHMCKCPGCCFNNVNEIDECNPLKWVAYGSEVTVKAEDCFKISKHFGLYALTSTSILRVLPCSYPGITSPYLYYGTTHSFFTAHYENESLYSFNFLHHGHSKIWIVVPPVAVRKLHTNLASTNLNMNHTTCSNLLGHKYFLLTPKWLEQNDIPFTVVVQREKEGVILTPNAVHFGWNCGFNISESCQFGNENWIQYGIVAPRCRCIGGEKHIDMERVIAAARPDLLAVYRNQTIPYVNEDEDPFYYLSILREQKSVGTIHFPPKVDIAKPNLQSIELPTSSVKRRGRKVLACPKTTCEMHYAYGQKQRLYNHVKKVHSRDSSFKQFMNDLDSLFPERNVTNRRQCILCGKMIAGRATQMMRHQMSTACDKRAS